MLKEEQTALRRFIDNCTDPQNVKRTVLDPQNVNPHSKLSKSVYWDDLSLVDGFGALVIFFATLDGLYPHEKFDLVTHQYILQIKDAIERGGLPEHSSLFSGTAGLCHALAFASKGRSRYLKILDVLESHLSSQILKKDIPAIDCTIQKGRPVNFKAYDLISGFSGVGLYYLKNKHNHASEQIIKELLRLSVAMSMPIRHHGHLVPGWICPGEFLHQAEDRQRHPLGILNMGLSHGVPGLLGWMSIALKAGIEVPGQIAAMKTIIEWLKSKITKSQGLQFFRPRISFEQQINHTPSVSDHLSNREAWCYGTPGVARTLYLAGRALNDQDTIDFATDAFVSIFGRPYEQWNLVGPTFCHGVAGTLVITHLMARDLKTEFLFSKVRELEKIVLSFYDSSAPFGFFDLDLCIPQQAEESVVGGVTFPQRSDLHSPVASWEMVTRSGSERGGASLPKPPSCGLFRYQDNTYCPLDKISLLTGATGTWLALLTTQLYRNGIHTPQWYYPFMIDYV
jgi:hypothetical protein